MKAEPPKRIAKATAIDERPMKGVGPKKMAKATILVSLFNELAYLFDNRLQMRRSKGAAFTTKEVAPPGFIQNGEPVVHVKGEGIHPIGEGHVDYDWHSDNF